MISLQQLHAFTTIVDCGSFRRAARELGVSQAGLTNSVQALEAELGVALLHRSVRGVSLTADGERLLPRARLMDREARRAVDEARTSRGEPGGTLHVGFGPTPTAMLLHIVLPDFHSRFPSIRLKLIGGFYEQMLPALQHGLIELAVLALPNIQPPAGFVRKLLFQSELVIVGRAGHPLANAKSLHELAGCEWILLGSPGRPGGTITNFYTEQGLAPPRVAATCESFTQLSALLSSTDWLALVPVALVDRLLMGPQVLPIRLTDCTPPRAENCMVYRKEPPLTPAAAAFAAMCESCSRIIAGVGT